jgi:hypothetical protein
MTVALALAMLCRATTAVASAGEWQPLVLKGARMPLLLGAPENRLEVMAMAGRRLAPIPFQVDEVRPDGHYVLQDGPEPVTGDGSGVFDREDELVMMLKDMGPPAPRGSIVHPRALEIEAIDRRGGPPRYAYVEVVRSPQLSRVRYVNYDPHDDRIETDFYRIGMVNGWPADFAILHHAGERAPNLIDRFKVRTSARILKFFHYHMNEDDVRNRLLAWKVGPVRMVRLESHSVNLLLGIRSPAIRSEVFAYRNFIDNPTRVSFPWAPRLVFDKVRVRVDVDYIDLSRFTLSWSGMTGPPIVIGDDSAEAVALERDDPPPANWIALRGDGRVMVQTFRPSPDLRLIQHRLYYRDSSRPDPPERYPGQHPGVGYVTTGWRNLAGGTHEVDSLSVILPGDYSPRTFLRELETPPVVKIRAIR